MTSPTSGSGRPKFVVLNSPLQGHTFVVLGMIANIGRSPDCEIQLDLASVSRAHARVEARGGMFILRDLGSRNGIRVAGQPVQETVLNDGDVVTIGDIDLRFEWPAPSSASSPSALAASSADPLAAPRPLTGADLVAAPPPAVAGDSAGDAPGGMSARTKLIIAASIGLVLAVVAGVLILRAGSRRAAAPRQGFLAPVMVKINETRWVSINGPQLIKIGDRFQWVELKEFGDIDVGDAEVVEAQRYGAGDLILIGKGVGETLVTLHMLTGSLVSIRVYVRGRLDDVFDNLTFGRYTPDERKAMARSFLNSGQLIEAEAPFLALQEYRKALAVLKPIKEIGEVYLRANERLSRVTQVVDSRWAKLRDDILVAERTNDRAKQFQLLQDAVKLIPDPGDPRNQEAQFKIQRLVRQEIRERERGHR